MERSIATAPAAASRTDGPRPGSPERGRRASWTFDPALIGLAFVVVALVVYVASNTGRGNFYDHFVWQADAYLHGRAWIPYPVTDGPFQNGYFQDVLPLDEGRALLPFPPLPAILLLPFVALWGLGTDAALLCAVLGAINVGLAWRLTTRLTDRLEAAVLATVFYAFGTVAWYAAMLGSTWFFAHVVASTFLLLAIARALDADHDAVEPVGGDGSADGPAVQPVPTVRSLVRAIRRGPGAAWQASRAFVDGAQFGAGLLFGIAGLARLTVMFGAPFFVGVGGGGSTARRAFSAGLGALIPISLLLVYNIATTGHVTLTHPAYDYLYRTEYTPREEFRHLDWGIEDPRYLVQNGGIMLLWPPKVAPGPAGCTPSLLDPECPILQPDPVGMSLPLTSPAYLLIAPLVFAAWRRRVVLGSALAVLSIAIVNVMHFSQGWVQFGYRFSNDFAPFALVLVTVSIARMKSRFVSWALVVAAVVINAWGVYWGVTLGW